MKDRKPRKWTIRPHQNGDGGAYVYSGDDFTKEECGGYIDVVEVLPDVDSKPSTINLKFPAYSRLKAFDLAQREYPGHPECRHDFVWGMKLQHEQDAQHFEAVVTELMEIVEMQRSGIVEIQAILCDEDNDGDFPERAIGQALEYSQHKILAAVDERLAKLKDSK